MKAIAAVDKNWGIGCNNKLLERIPEDMKFFADMTLGKVVVMGRETFDSLPGRRPLKDRVNIVLSKSIAGEIDGVTICNSIEELRDELLAYQDDEVFVIGGSSVYRQLLPFCTDAYVTKFSNSHEADCFFPDLDLDDSWEACLMQENLLYDGLEYSRVRYLNKKKNKKQSE